MFYLILIITNITFLKMSDLTKLKIRSLNIMECALNLFNRASESTSVKWSDDAKIDGEQTKRDHIS